MKDSFLEQTARSIVELIDWKQLSSTTLVLPSHRAGLVLKNELLRLQKEQGQKAIWAPDVKTLTQLQDTLSPLYTEDELFTIVRLYRHYLRLNAGDNDLMPLDMFYGWGRQMIADFTNVDASMAAEQVPNFFDNAIAANKLDNLILEQETKDRLKKLVNENARHGAESIYDRYAVIWEQLYELYKALHEEMAAEQKGYAGMRQRAVIEQWDGEYVQSQIAGRTYVFVGFNYLLPVERQLMEKLRNSNQALFFWDFVPQFKTNVKAFHFAERNSGNLGNAEPNIQNIVQLGLPKEVTVMACSSSEAQAQYVHRWLQDNYTAKGQKVGVVICDESMLESVIYTIPTITLPGETEPEPVNITKGFPLRNTQIYARVLGWLYDKARGDVEQVVSPDFIEDLLNALFPKEPKKTEKEQTEAETTETPLTWKELLILESEYQVRKVANQMRLVIANGIGDVPFTLKLLRLLMRRAMENVTMPFHGEPITDIQIMGVLETRMMDFDKLLILNVEEGVIPQKQTDNSFIPYYLRKAYSMQTPDEKATIYAYNFFRLLSRAGHSTLLYTTTEGAEGSKGMSRFIMQILVSPEFHVQKMNLQEPSILPEIDDARLGTSGTSMLQQLETGDDGFLRYKGSERHYRLSPSALNTYITCPRQFCLRYIKHLPETPEKETIFKSSTIGSFVHQAMQYLYEKYVEVDNVTPKQVLPEVIENILQDETIIDAALDHAFEAVNKDWLRHHKGEANHYIRAEHPTEQSIIVTFIRNILKRDLKDAKEGCLEICSIEQDRSFAVPIGEKGSIEIGGRIDRLDRYKTEEAQKIRVVDYKSGVYSSNDLAATLEKLMDSKKSYVRQTFIYGHCVESELPIEPNLFYCSCDLTNLRTTISLDRNVLTDYSTIRESFYKMLVDKANEIMTTTEFPPCKDGDCPPQCPYMEHCRRKAKKNNE